MHAALHEVLGKSCRLDGRWRRSAAHLRADSELRMTVRRVSLCSIYHTHIQYSYTPDLCAAYGLSGSRMRHSELLVFICIFCAILYWKFSLLRHDVRAITIRTQKAGSAFAVAAWPWVAGTLFIMGSVMRFGAVVWATTCTFYRPKTKER